MILQDIGGSDIERRDKALTCLCFLLPYCKLTKKLEPALHEDCIANAARSPQQREDG